MVDNIGLYLARSIGAKKLVKTTTKKDARCIVIHSMDQVQSCVLLSYNSMEIDGAVFSSIPVHWKIQDILELAGVPSTFLLNLFPQFFCSPVENLVYWLKRY